MENRKVVKIIQQLTPKELGRLQRFLDSPYLNTREDVRVLFDWISTATFEDLATEEREVFARLFPDSSLTDREIRDRMRYLLDCVERFLELEDFQEDKMERGHRLLNGLWEHKMEAPFRTKYKFIRRRLEGMPHRDANYHHHNFRLWEAHYNATQTRPEEAHEELQAMAEHLDAYFILQKLRLACSVVAHQQLYQVEYELGLLEPVLHYIESHELTRNQAIAMYYHAYRMLALSSQADFYALKAQLPTDPAPFPTGEMRFLFRLAINFCIKRLNQGEAGFIREVFELYQQALESGILLQEGELSPFTYKNIVSAGLKLAEYEWVKDFIEQYKKRLPERVREDFYHFNLAEWHFARREFREVPRQLLNQVFRDPFTALSARIMLIKAYIELEDQQMAAYQLDTFKHFLRRRSEITYHKEHYRKFIRYANRLISLGPGEDSEAEKLAKEIRQAEGLSEREWLLEKLGA